jgi:hypothetical protein
MKRRTWQQLQQQQQQVLRAARTLPALAVLLD